MKSVYKVLAYIVALEVMVQASMIAFAVFGLGVWIEDGGVLDKAALEGEDLDFTGVLGFMVHGINGMMIIPILTLIFFIVSFFAKVPHGVRTAAILLVLVVIQVTLGILGHGVPYLGILHGLNALLIFGTALYAGRLAGSASTVETEGAYVEA